MSDARLRELERRWRETGAVADLAALLVEQVRVGGRSSGRLEVAASLGHAAAACALGRAGAAVASLVELLSRPLPAREVALRAAVAAARAVVDHARHDEWEPFEDELVAVEAGLVCPCEAHRRTLMALGGRAGPDEAAFVEPELGLQPWFAITWLTSAALRNDHAAAIYDLTVAARAAQAHVGTGAVLERVRQEVAPWLVGERDPVRERRAGS